MKETRYIVVDAGHGSKAVAADLAVKGFTVHLYNRTAERVNEIALRSEMGFVCPRPPALFEYERELAEGNVHERLARAGLVGLQQAHKGRAQSFEEETVLDYEYVA